MSDYLPQELIVEIFSRLPPKTLVRFRGVCKSWRSLISSPEFISTHTRNHTYSAHNPRKLYRRFIHGKEHYYVHLDNDSFDLDSESPIMFPFEGIAPFYFRIVGCCKGLLCLSDDLFEATTTVILWNPAIRRKLVLPHAPLRPHNVIGNVTIEIPTNCMYALGFGFDSRMDDFKVVRISYIGCYRGYVLPPMVEIYTVKDGAWREVDFGSPSPLHSICIVGHFWAQAFVNRAVHWIAINPVGGPGGGVSSSILSFDMNNEVFGEIILPECLIVETPINMKMHAVGELLSLIQWDYIFGSIWVMKEYGVDDSWCKMCNIEPIISVGRPLDVRNNGEILLGDRGCEFASFNPQTNRYKLLHTIGSMQSIYVNTYTESLALFTEGDEIRDTDTHVREYREELSDQYVLGVEAAAGMKARLFYDTYYVLRRFAHME